MRKRIQHKGYNLMYQYTGVGDNVVLLLHGNTGSHQDMKVFEEKLNQTCSVINIDLPGHGKSGYSNKLRFTISSFASEVEELLEALQIKEVSVIGYSDGGNVALELASNKRVSIKKCVLISSNSKVSGVKFYWNLLFTSIYILLYTMSMVFKGFKLAAKTVGLMILNYRINRKKLSSINSDVLLLYAERDIIRKSHIRYMHKIIPNNVLKVYLSRNHFNILKEEVMIDDIIDFIEE